MVNSFYQLVARDCCTLSVQCCRIVVWRGSVEKWNDTKKWQKLKLFFISWKSHSRNRNIWREREKSTSGVQKVRLKSGFMREMGFLSQLEQLQLITLESWASKTNGPLSRNYYLLSFGGSPSTYKIFPMEFIPYPFLDFIFLLVVFLLLERFFGPRYLHR